MHISAPPDSDAVSRLYQSDVRERGYVMNLSRVWAWRPDLSDAFVALRRQLAAGSSLRPRELAVLVCATAAGLGDAYCALAWGTRLADAADARTAASVLDGAPGGALTARERALAGWARRVVADPNATECADVDALRAAGLDDREVFEATLFIALRLAFSTVNDALGATPDAQLVADAPAEVRAAVRYGRPAE